MEVAGAVFVFQTDGVESEEGVLCPEKRSGFRALIAEMQFDAFHFMRGDDSSVLRPAIVIDGCRYSVGRRGCGEDIHNHTFVVSMYGEVHFPAIGGAPVPV